ncbi:formylglycine-generating enzyme family protein [Bacillus altitudinis]|uniref:formylglycine-generating enzyme family protein n=1 Tax=Bacillus TaxID=1386 RepID=UPI00148ED4A5|nr:SUMF1/EgtB/PvdO family nonheme iron enzyme [Bacillus altitudinis]MCY7627823.1 formylglycine-generating enzyme family protein [Bacillus altitudinis]MDX2363703.1 formylglycine-generating enzyme family protein [Bacillus altitudinis]NOL32013.1 formylglycine-generating enzyme family protein [Bacillus altitudinis]
MIKNLKFKYIEAGEFHFGTEWNKEKFINMVNNYNVPLEWLLKEVPQKKVYLNDYWISETPVTIGMMKEFYQNNPHVQMPLVIKKHINNNDLDFPAYHINFEDALMFCYWASETLGECIDLPTEPEWEKAARGSWDDREFPWGDEIIENVNIKGHVKAIKHYKGGNGENYLIIGGNNGFLQCYRVNKDGSLLLIKEYIF